MKNKGKTVSECHNLLHMNINHALFAARVTGGMISTSVGGGGGWGGGGHVAFSESCQYM